MKRVKVIIFQKNEDSLDEIVQFLSNPENSKEFYLKMNRDKFINEILSISDPIHQWMPFLESLSPIKLYDKYGSTYQSKYREVLNISTISHHIKNIVVENNTLYGVIDILDTPVGGPIQSLDAEQMVLNPIYNNTGEIITFDIDFNIREAA